MDVAEDELPEASWLRFFGEELRLMREARGLTLRELSAMTTYSFQQISNVEAARRTPSEALARELDRALGTGDRFQRILKRVLANPYPDWFKGAAVEEQRASEIRIYEGRVVPGLFQIEEYTRAQTKWMQPRMPMQQVESVVAGRMKRQTVLERDDAPCVWVILDESALLRPIGGPDVMRAQLERLQSEAQKPNIVLQVIPVRATEHAGLDGSFFIWTYKDRPDAVYAEGYRMGRLMEHRDDVANAHLSYDLLQALALNPANSLDLIRTIVKDEYSA
jgi:transcriptional regulator with XRE-family HTH domain